jgi:hypothetical protein
MNYYTFGITEGTTERYIILGHKMLFDKDRFDAIISKAIEVVVDERISNNLPVHSMKDIWVEVVSFLSEEREFVPMQTVHNWRCYGLASIFVDDYNINSDSKLKEVRDLLNSKGYGLIHDSEYAKYFAKGLKKGELDDKKDTKQD